MLPPVRIGGTGDPMDAPVAADRRGQIRAGGRQPEPPHRAARMDLTLVEGVVEDAGGLSLLVQSGVLIPPEAVGRPHRGARSWRSGGRVSARL